MSSSEKDETIPKQIKSIKGKNSFSSGKRYETKIHATLQKILINNEKYTIQPIAGSKYGSDIKIIGTKGTIGFEIKTSGGFEGGCKKLYYANGRLSILDNCIHKEIIGDTLLYNGNNLPWYNEKRTIEDWNKVKLIFEKDIYLTANPDDVSKYYRNIGSYYIQIQNYGLYHTGEDILELGVPYFSCNVSLRIRVTKHIKNGVPTDVTAALQFDKRSLEKSKYSLENILPPIMKEEE